MAMKRGKTGPACRQAIAEYRPLCGILVCRIYTVDHLSWRRICRSPLKTAESRFSIRKTESKLRRRISYCPYSMQPVQYAAFEDSWLAQKQSASLIRRVLSMPLSLSAYRSKVGGLTVNSCVSSSKSPGHSGAKYFHSMKNEDRENEDSMKIYPEDTLWKYTLWSCLARSVQEGMEREVNSFD